MYSSGKRRNMPGDDDITGPARPVRSGGFSLRSAMDWLQGDLVRALTNGRRVLPHPGEVGDNAELRWIEMLGVFLPTRYSVSKAFVVDVTGSISEQIDVVIFDQQYTPRIFRRDDTLYVPAESVYAVFEVKQEVTKAHIEYAAGKIGSVRRLERTSAPIPHAGGTFNAKAPASIIGGLLSLSSGWHPPFGDAFASALGENSDPDFNLDLGCAASAGAFACDSDGRLDDLWPAQEGALVWFVTRLLARLQQVATVPAIDIVRWADAALAEQIPSPDRPES